MSVQIVRKVVVKEVLATAGVAIREVEIVVTQEAEEVVTQEVAVVVTQEVVEVEKEVVDVLATESKSQLVR